MKELDRHLTGVTLVSRSAVLALGGTDAMIQSRVHSGRWIAVHAGVYRIGPLSNTWVEALEAALLAAGPRAAVSHRSASRLWGLEGIDTIAVEITVPYRHSPIPAGVVRHRTRRRLPVTTIGSLQVTTVERTLLDVAPLLPPPALIKNVDSALRLGLTTHERIARVIGEQGGRGVRGGKRLSGVLGVLDPIGATDSAAEAAVLLEMRRRSLPIPVAQWQVTTVAGPFRVDFGWPTLNKGVEIDGLTAHSSAERLERDLRRQNAISDLGIELRRFSGRQVQTDVKAVVDAIAAFLAS